MNAANSVRTTGGTFKIARSVRRVAWLGVGLFVLGFGIFEVTKHGLGWLPLLGFIVMPDLAMLAGAGQAHLRRQMPSRAVPLYNLLHNPILPIALIAVASIGVLDLPWFVAGLGWLTHIAIDRAVGYNLRTPDGWIRG
jgi:Domain of unknown function (DUF4260)